MLQVDCFLFLPEMLHEVSLFLREYRTVSAQFIGNEVPFYCPLVEL